MKKITKWCIRRTPENCDIINEWFTVKSGKHRFTKRSDYRPPFMSYKESWTYLHYPPHKNKYLRQSIVKGYSEITFEEFQNMVNGGITFLKSKSKNDIILRDE